MTQILVVDDEQSILELIKNGLRKDGYLITACQTAADVDMHISGSLAGCYQITIFSKPILYQF